MIFNFGPSKYRWGLGMSTPEFTVWLRAITTTFGKLSCVRGKFEAILFLTGVQGSVLGPLLFPWSFLQQGG